MTLACCIAKVTRSLVTGRITKRQLSQITYRVENTNEHSTSVLWPVRWADKQMQDVHVACKTIAKHRLEFDSGDHVTRQ
jgi:hypothetical protein